MHKNSHVSVVIPAYCEERLLPRTLSGIPSFVDHIIVVDDGSPDDTYDVALQCAQQDARIEVIRLVQNSGVGSAIVRGYQRALELEVDAVAVMAADDQMDPEELLKVFDPVLNNLADYAKGNRLAHPDAHHMPPVRRFGTQFLAKLTGIIAGFPDLQDAQCGYTAISSNMLMKLPLEKLYPRYGYPNDLLLRLGEAGGRLAQPAVRPVYADEVSGLKVHKVIAPISGILLRGVVRRLRSVR